MPDFQFNSFPINATPLADVSENTSADGVLVVRNGAVQKVPKASAAHAIGALDSTDLEPYVKKEQTVNNYPLDGDIVIQAVDVPFTPTAGIESNNVQNAIVEAVGLLSEAHETSLYVNAGTSSAAGNYALSGDIDDYDYLDIYTSFSGLNDIRRIPVEPGRSYCLRFLNLANTDTSTFVEWSEILLSFSDAVMTVAHNKCVNWNGKVNSDAVVATSGKPYIVKVMGIKYDLIGTQGGTIVVDNALSPNSTNPVQNKVIYNALNNAGISDDIKLALLNCFANVAWIGNDGQDYYDALQAALYNVPLVSITADFDPTETIYDTMTLDDLKQFLTVTANYGDGTEAVVNDYTLSGTLTAGTSTITVTYSELTTTFSVTVVGLVSITATYTQSGAVYTDDALDDLKADLVVTANYSDSTTETVPAADYTISGSMAAGTNTYTVTYEGFTDTFSATITAPLYSIPDFAEQTVTYVGKSGTIKKENGVYTVTGAMGDVFYIAPNGTAYDANSKPTATWFNVSSGQRVQEFLEIYEWENPTSASITFSSKYSRSDGGGNVYTADYVMEANSSGTSATGQYDATVTNSRTISAYAVQAQSNRTQSVMVKFRHRLFVDGVRYL